MHHIKDLSQKMEDQSNAGPPSKRQRTITIANDTSGSSTNSTTSPQNEGGVLAAVNKFKLTKLVEEYPHLYSKVERMLKDLYNKLEPEAVSEEVSAATRKLENEIFCLLYNLSNDAFGHIFGYVGEKQYGFVACTSYIFHQVNLKTFENEILTSFTNATVSVSCVKLCLAASTTERPRELFNTAARDGKLIILKWEEDFGYDLKNV